MVPRESLSEILIEELLKEFLLNVKGVLLGILKGIPELVLRSLSSEIKKVFLGRIPNGFQ